MAAKPIGAVYSKLRTFESRLSSPCVMHLSAEHLALLTMLYSIRRTPTSPNDMFIYTQDSSYRFCTAVIAIKSYSSLWRYVLTRMPPNPRSITRECVYLVRRGHFRSCNKDGGHTNRSAIAENSMLRFFAPATLTLTMTFIYELDRYPLKMYPHLN